ncbi:hypothetical protein [Rhodanobacter hydrolyticus]|uniref:Tetratricopeptide repeat protein n=1 Tax=Rhodanobacter hydrolyticus TaxID=2250595 RepID=A0ABW8J9X3_9GAMM
MKILRFRRPGFWLLLGFLGITAAIYWPGLSGYWLFDDYPNIVDNHGVQPASTSIPALINAALSSPSSDFKRPLASLSFAANYLASGLNPWSWKLINLIIHLLNGLLAFVLAKKLLTATLRSTKTEGPGEILPTPAEQQTGILAALIAGGWLVLPVNVTAVLYVVQRMESMANLFVMLGLIGYVAGRQSMLRQKQQGWAGLSLCVSSLIAATSVGLLAKETAVMLPLYAILIEWLVFGFRSNENHKDWRIASLFVMVLLLPMIIGITWLLHGLLNPAAWATRDFTMSTRLLSEARIVMDYLVWTVLPTPHALSFYHDDFNISTGLLQPWTTLACVLALAALGAAIFAIRKRQPLAALGLALFLGCQSLTATIIPLELIFEHRNYFASFGLMLAIIPSLTPVRSQALEVSRFMFARRVLLIGLLLLWASQTLATSIEWSNPISMAESLAVRRPTSPRAQYELGRTYIIYSNYDPTSPFTKLAYAPLERSAALPGSSILPEQALIFMNARMHLPIKDAWWTSLIGKLKAHKPGIQDESSLAALTKCVQDSFCDLPVNRMMEAFMAALSHPNPDARLLANYGDYGWNVLNDKGLGLRMTEASVEADPHEPVYRITLIRMLAALGRKEDALDAIKQLEALNYGDRLSATLAQLRALPALQ